MRFLALFAVPALLAASPASDWSASARRTPAGVAVGNPAASVKLVEYASFTCSHCAHFAGDAMPVLKGQMVRSGSTSYELRHMVRDRLDLAAVAVARCGSPAGYWRRSEAIFAKQAEWLPRGAEWDRAHAAAPAGQSPAARLRALADGAGLSAIGRAAGLTDAALAACFAPARVQQIAALNDAIPAEVNGTPTFYLNGSLVGSANWAMLEPRLRAAGAK